MNIMSTLNTILFIVSLVLIGLATFAITSHKDVPETITLPLIGGTIRFKYLVFANGGILYLLMYLVYKYTTFFTWVSSLIILIGLITVISAYIRGINKRKNAF